jgi:hypothetical protein
MFGFSAKSGNSLAIPLARQKFGLDRQVKNTSIWTAWTGQAPASDSQHLDLFTGFSWFAQQVM